MRLPNVPERGIVAQTSEFVCESEARRVRNVGSCTVFIGRAVQDSSTKPSRRAAISVEPAWLGAQPDCPQAELPVIKDAIQA